MATGKTPYIVVDNNGRLYFLAHLKPPWEWVLEHIRTLKNRGFGSKTVKIACFLTPSLGVSGRC